MASSSFKKLVNQESYNVGISVIKLIRTDTDIPTLILIRTDTDIKIKLDLSQKAEKSARCWKKRSV